MAWHELPGVVRAPRWRRRGAGKPCAVLPFTPRPLPARGPEVGEFVPAAGASAQSTGVAFVFQGGGSLAAPQVGALRALIEAGIQPDLVIGTSAGALNAVAFAADPTLAGVDRLELLWRSLRRKSVAPLSLRTVLAGMFGRSDGLIGNSALIELLGSGIVPPGAEPHAAARPRGHH
jgi:NTE family protein